MNQSGQANVIGVALLLGITVVSVGAISTGVGLVVETHADAVEADRVASDLVAVFDTADSGRGSVSFHEGRLVPLERELVVRADGAEVTRIRTDALVYENGEARVAFHTGAIVRGEGDESHFQRDPVVIVDDDLLLVGIASIGTDVDGVAGSGGVSTTVTTNVSHERHELDADEIRLSIETSAPGAWERFLRDQGAAVGRIRGDPPIVEATFEGSREGFVVVHDLGVEVNGRA